MVSLGALLDGCCLSFNGVEKAYRPTEWMRYLVDNFLKPGAEASDSGLECFREFTFDHVVDGVIVGCRRDTGRLFSIDVRNNRVRERELMLGVPEEAVWGPLPYQDSVDSSRPPRRRRKIDRLIPARQPVR